MESGRLIFNATGSGAGQMLFLDCGAGGGLFHRVMKVGDRCWAWKKGAA
jgi:hypothetical protein